MIKVLLMLPDSFEETEAVTTIDILRRGGVSVQTVSLTKSKTVTGSHNITVNADTLFWHIAEDDNFDMLVLPGGPGTMNYKTHEGLLLLIQNFYEAGKGLAAICAAPTVFGMLGLLKGKKAVCFPGLEAELKGAEICDEKVVADGHIITSKGPGTAVPFALKLVELLTDAKNAEKVAKDFIYTT